MAVHEPFQDVPEFIRLDVIQSNVADEHLTIGTPPMNNNRERMDTA